MVYQILRKIVRYIKKSVYVNYKRSYAQSGEDMILNTIFNGIKKGIYVDVGANDPYLQSNTQYFYEMGWSGINIEPNGKLIKKLNKKRKRDLNIKALISDTGKELDYYYYESSFFNGCEYNANIPSKFLYKEKIQSNSLTSLLLEYGFTKIDFLSIDVEGHDLNVLKTLDLTRIKPKIILIESFSKDIFQDLNSEISIYLMSHDYMYLCRTLSNTFYILKNFSSVRFKN
jgi:FkbM family methyltransferase